MNIQELNGLSEGSFIEHVLKVCGSYRWACNVSSKRPFGSKSEFVSVAVEEWEALELSQQERKRLTYGWSCKYSGFAEESFEMGQDGKRTRRESWSALLHDYVDRFGYEFVDSAESDMDKLHGNLRNRIGNSPKEEEMNMSKQFSAQIQRALQELLE